MIQCVRIERTSRKIFPKPLPCPKIEHARREDQLAYLYILRLTTAFKYLSIDLLSSAVRVNVTYRFTTPHPTLGLPLAWKDPFPHRVICTLAFLFQESYSVVLSLTKVYLLFYKWYWLEISALVLVEDVNT